MADKWAKGCRGWYEPIPVKHHVNGCLNLLSKCSYRSCPLEPKNRLHWTIYPQVLSSIGLIILYCFVGIERQSVLQRDFFNKLVQTDRWRILSTFPIYPSLGGHHSKSELSQSVRGILSFWFNLGRPQIVTKTSPMLHVIYPCMSYTHVSDSITSGIALASLLQAFPKHQLLRMHVIESHHFFVTQVFVCVGNFSRHCCG